MRSRHAVHCTGYYTYLEWSSQSGTHSLCPLTIATWALTMTDQGTHNQSNTPQLHSTHLILDQQWTTYTDYFNSIHSTFYRSLFTRDGMISQPRGKWKLPFLISSLARAILYRNSETLLKSNFCVAVSAAEMNQLLLTLLRPSRILGRRTAPHLINTKWWCPPPPPSRLVLATLYTEYMYLFRRP